MRISDLLARESDPKSPLPIGQLDRWVFGEGGRGGQRNQILKPSHISTYQATMTPHGPISSFPFKSQTPGLQRSLSIVLADTLGCIVENTSRRTNVCKRTRTGDALHSINHNSICAPPSSHSHLL